MWSQSQESGRTGLNSVSSLLWDLTSRCVDYLKVPYRVIFSEILYTVSFFFCYLTEET